MGPQFVLVGIPTIQIAHETYEEILLRNQLTSTVTDPDGFIQVIKSLEEMGAMPQET